MAVVETRNREDAGRAARELLSTDGRRDVCFEGAAAAVRGAVVELELHVVAGCTHRWVVDLINGLSGARAALEKLGLPPAPILTGPSREPLWPDGIVGSITHCAGLSAAAVARSGDIAGLGIDAERTAVSADLEALILTPGERRLLPRDEEARRVLRSVLFSIKECVFKCIFPATKTYVEFREVNVALSGPDGFSAEISASLAVPSPFRNIGGRYAATDKFVIAVAEVRATP